MSSQTQDAEYKARRARSNASDPTKAIKLLAEAVQSLAEAVERIERSTR
jgi:hypothetical protein